jgi:hypothetical protein
VNTAPGWLVHPGRGHHYQQADRGILTLHGTEDSALEDAQERMSAHCGAGHYRIVKRETVRVGQEAYSVTEEKYGEQASTLTKTDDGAASKGKKSAQEGELHSVTVSGVRDLTEERLSYVCQR